MTCLRHALLLSHQRGGALIETPELRVEYQPTWNEILVCAGIWAFGLLLYTILVRITIPVLAGRCTADQVSNEKRATPAPSGLS